MGSNTGPFGDFAKQYRKLGWLGTLPLPPGSKNPPPKDFTGSGRPYPTDKQIASWLKERAQPNQQWPDGWAYKDGNIALRLAEVPPEYLAGRDDLPFAYAGNNVDGWELIGIDVDDYKDKNGHTELLELERELGPLPATAMSSARWATWREHKSAIRIFLVPKGYRYMGKASSAIEVIQKRHRFMVVHPSTNPDASGALYEWRWGSWQHNVDDGGDGRYGALQRFDGGIPDLSHGNAEGGDEADIAVLPEAWFVHLSRGGTIESEDPISSMSDDELFAWAQTLRYGDEPCAAMRKAVQQCIDKLESGESSHDKITYAHWRLFNLAAEGHAGLGWALDTFHPAWRDHVLNNRGDIEAASAELGRSAMGALDKIEPLYAGLGRPEDTCAVSSDDFDTDAWTARYEDERIAAGDFDGLGPVVGRMEVLPTKPAGEYGQHDDGNGQHFIDLYGANVKYVDGRDSWVLWDGERWHRDVAGRKVALAFRRVRQAQENYAGMLAAEARQNDDKAQMALAKKWFTWARRSGDNGPIKEALKAAERLNVNGDDVAMHMTVFDSKPNLLGCLNGVIDLNDTEIDVRPPRKEDYVAFNTNTMYVPWRSLVNSEGEAYEGWMLWTEYLNLVLPDLELREYVQMALGHLMVGGNPGKRIVFLQGPHDTGKSTMIGAIKGALGDYFGTVNTSLFKHKELNPGLIRAVPLRIVGMNEVVAGAMDAEQVKSLTGNDEVQAEAKYSNEIFTGTPQFTPLVGCNEMPHIKNADEALEERILVLPFETEIPRADRKFDRQDDIGRHSRVAVLSWLIEGWKLYQEKGLGNPPNQVKRKTRNAFVDLNTTRRFMDEILVKLNEDTAEGRRILAVARKKARDRGATKVALRDLPKEWTAPSSDVYQEYLRWCHRNGVMPLNHPELTKELACGRPEPRSVNGKAVRCYMGVKIKPNENVGSWKVK